MPSPQNAFLSWALRYLKLGWPVIPLKGKIPLTKNGSKDASLNETQIKAWWQQWPEANVGLATGVRFFAVDIDIKSGGEETWDMLKHQHGELPETIEQITGSGGKHILYRLPDFPVYNSAGKIGPGIDVRGKGGYIVASPSIHPETKRAYTWDGLAEIEDQKMAAAPPWLLIRISAEERKPGPALVKVPDKISEGGRNNTLFKTAARLRRLGFSPEELFGSIKLVNEKRCSPPLPDSELRTIAESAGRYTPDAKASLFTGKSSAVPQQVSEVVPEEMPLGAADVEAAIDDAIARNDLLGAMKLIPEIARLRPAAQVLIKTKLGLHFKKEFPSRDFDRALKDIAAGKQPPPPPPPDEDAETVGGASGPDLLGYPLTDSGNGERIVALYGNEIRYCVEMQKWLVWDGRRWAIDDRQVITQKAKHMARLLHAQAALLMDQSKVKAIEKHARQSESAAGIAAALKRAGTEKNIPISALELDQHEYLLNCLNGVVDLRSGKLLPHDREYLITKCCHVNYDPNAECKRFIKFLDWAMGQNPEAEMTERTVRMKAFLQRAFGYSLTADVSEKAAFIFWGERGNNGKTTLLTTFKEMLAEYSCQISIDTLMTTKSQDAAVRADLADLRGARFVTTSEVEREHKLSEGKLKYITAGMGQIKSCRKYENPIEFNATHKLFMDANHRPTVRGTDDAIWSRLKCVSFDVRIEKDDPEFDAKLQEKLTAEWPGILAWAVRGCVVWLKEGLGEPPEISQANINWREHDDPLKDFLEDCCEINMETKCQPDGLYVRASELSAAYEWWCKRSREKWGVGREQFGERLRSKGFEANRSRRVGEKQKQTRTWEGLCVKADILNAMRGEDKYRQTLLED